MKFKVGDTVKIVADITGGDYGVGYIGVIARISDSPSLPYIVYVDGENIWCCDGELELVESAPTVESLLRDMCRVREELDALRAELTKASAARNRFSQAIVADAKERASENWQDYLGPNARKAFGIDSEDES